MAQSGIVLWASIFFIDVILAGAMAITWANFGRPRHALSWAIAFAIGALRSIAAIVAIVLGEPEPAMMLVYLLVLLPAPIGAIGARQRVGMASGWRGFAAAAIGAVAAMVAADRSTDPLLHALGPAVAFAFAALCALALAAAVRQRAHPSEAAEQVTVAAALLLATVEASIAIATWASLAFPLSAGAVAALHIALAVAAPSAVVAIGVAEMLLLASDLAGSLRRVAANDPLTGLLNRRGFDEAARRLLFNAWRHHLPVTVVLADIDHFKAINDRHGHAAGDVTLAHVATRLAVAARAGDIVSRIGGEEFAMLLVDRTAMAARGAIDQLRADIGSSFVNAPTGEPVTVSFGVGEIDYGLGSVSEMLAAALDRADRALYLSKVQGRDRVTVAV